MIFLEKSNNFSAVKGIVVSLPAVSHSIMEENFYLFSVSVKRLSGSCDTINVTVSEKLLKLVRIEIGDIIEITGQFRSYNNYSQTGNKLVLTVFALDLSHIEDEDGENPNYIYLNGFVCKKPVYRVTPFGREITDILIAVNRAYNKSDYMPCIAWGRNARFSSDLEVGTNIKIWGRIQSIEYQKKLSEDETITKTAFEISISKMEVEENLENADIV